MSRVNPVNPGIYTQAGRLTPDDAARERAKQRQSIRTNERKGHPKARNEAWMHQASRSRDHAAAPAGRSYASAVVMLAAGAAVCLSLYVARRLALAARSRRPTSSVPATNHTPGDPYAYGV